MSENINKAYSEIDEILQLLQSDFVDKVPLKIRNFFREQKDKEYIVKINPNIPLENQELLPETISILALLKLDYWCENNQEKQELLKILQKNEIEYQTEIERKYSSENIFNKNNKTEISQLPTDIKKESLRDKILKFIHKLFKRI